MKIRRSGSGIAIELDELKILVNPKGEEWDIDADFVVCTNSKFLREGVRVAKESEATLVGVRELPRLDIYQITPTDFQALGRGVWVGRVNDKLFLLVDEDGKGTLIAEKNIMKEAKELVKKVYLGDIDEFEI